MCVMNVQSWGIKLKGGWWTGTLVAADTLGGYVSKVCKYSGCPLMKVGIWGGRAEGCAYLDIYYSVTSRGQPSEAALHHLWASHSILFHLGNDMWCSGMSMDFRLRPVISTL